MTNDFEESGRCYEWSDELGLMCWVQEGWVTSLSALVLYDEAGKVPQWPVP